MDISLSANQSKVIASSSIKDFTIIRALNVNVNVNYMKAPRIIEFYWLPPSLGRIKINSDGVAHRCPSHTGRAMLAIEMAYTKGWKCIWIECDSSLVVDIFNGKGLPPWKLLYRELLASMDYKVTHIFREEDVFTDRLANFGISSNCYTIWDIIPNFLLHECARNSAGMPIYRSEMTIEEDMLRCFNARATKTTY
ncbi:hypothetical protein Lal_00015922 [Lupinus albus]|nr:hypothetical protein Lal_00015922 [Lupinus albus]